MSIGAAQLDRRQLLAASHTLNGVDFVDVAPSQTQLQVHFINSVGLKGSLGTTGGDDHRRRGDHERARAACG